MNICNVTLFFLPCLLFLFCSFFFHIDSYSTNPIKSLHLHTAFEWTIVCLYGDVGIPRFTRNLSIIYYHPSTCVWIVWCLRGDKHVTSSSNIYFKNNRMSNRNTWQCLEYLVDYSIEQLLSMNFQSTKINQQHFKCYLKQRKKR